MQGLADPVWLIGAEEPRPKHLAPTQSLEPQPAQLHAISHVN